MLYSSWSRLCGPEFIDFCFPCSAKSSPTPSGASQQAAVTNDLLGSAFAQQQNLSIEQQRIIEEERQRLEAFVTQARLKSPTTTQSADQGNGVTHAGSDGDLLELFSPIPQSSNQPQQSQNALFDDFFFQTPAGKMSCVLRGIWVTVNLHITP